MSYFFTWEIPREKSKHFIGSAGSVLPTNLFRIPVSLLDMVEIPFEVIFLICCTFEFWLWSYSSEPFGLDKSFCILLVLQFGNWERAPVSMQKICKCILRLLTETLRVWHPFQAVCQISMNGFLKIHSLNVREANWLFPWFKHQWFSAWPLFYNAPVRVIKSYYNFALFLTK